jgi:hypothetical protein
MKLLLALIAIGLVTFFAFSGPQRVLEMQTMASAPHRVEAEKAQERFVLTEARKKHILYGSKTGGGHKAGHGKPGKNEFPRGWDDEKILSAALHIANDTSLPMRQSRNYWLRMGEVDGVQIRVVIDREKGEIVTAYPTDRVR